MVNVGCWWFNPCCVRLLGLPLCVATGHCTSLPAKQKYRIRKSHRILRLRTSILYMLMACLRGRCWLLGVILPHFHIPLYLCSCGQAMDASGSNVLRSSPNGGIDRLRFCRRTTHVEVSPLQIHSRRRTVGQTAVGSDSLLSTFSSLIGDSAIQWGRLDDPQQRSERFVSNSDIHFDITHTCFKGRLN